MESVCREREGVCFEIETEGVCVAIERVCGEIERECVCVERERDLEIDCVQNDRNMFMSRDRESVCVCV